MSEFVARLNENSTRSIKILNEETIQIDKEIFNYKLIKLSEKKYLLKYNNKIFEVLLVNYSNDNYEIIIDNKQFKINILTTLQSKAVELLQSANMNKTHFKEIKSPMPGLVVKINKVKDEKVKKGETIVVLEAMKMENEIKAPADGTIAEIYIKTGSAIEKNILLFSIK